MKKVTYTCDYCGKTSDRFSFGHYGTWITLTYHEDRTPFENTQFGLIQNQITVHFHSPECLRAWLAKSPLRSVK